VKLGRKGARAFAMLALAAAAAALAASPPASAPKSGVPENMNGAYTIANGPGPPAGASTRP
jgi:hypothetical protein